MQIIFTSLIVLAVLIVLAAVVILAVGGKAIWKGFKEGWTERRKEEEAVEDLSIIEGSSGITTLDGKAEVAWDEHGNLKWVRLVGGVKYDSFEDLFRLEEMDMKTYENLCEIWRSLENAHRYQQETRYKPKYRTEYNTEEELGMKLYVYRPGKLKISERMMVFIDEINNEMGITGVMVCANGLSSGMGISILDLIGDEHTSQEQVRNHRDAWADYLIDPKYREEAKLVAELQSHLELYNWAVANRGLLISGGKVYFRKYTEEKFTMLDEAPEPVKMSPRKQVEEALRGAQKYEAVSK